MSQVHMLKPLRIEPAHRIIEKRFGNYNYQFQYYDTNITVVKIITINIISIIFIICYYNYIS